MLPDFFEPVRLLQRIETPDDIGGVQVEYKPVLDFEAGIITISSTEAIIAGLVGGKTVYKILTVPEIIMEQHDVVHRISDGTMMRITGNSIRTPAPAQVQFLTATAEAIS